MTVSIIARIPALGVSQIITALQKKKNRRIKILLPKRSEFRVKIEKNNKIRPIFRSVLSVFMMFLKILFI
jgi:hypothetical protein